MNLKERNFNCKYEELPVVCGFALNSLKRDAADFAAFSSKFSEAYISEFETKIANVNALVNPRSDTADLKTVTAQLYATMDGLIAPLNRLEGYVKLAKNDIPLSLTDFGCKDLRSKLRKRDAEGALNALRLLNANVAKYNTALTAVGFNDEQASVFVDALNSIAAYNEQQYNLLTTRKELVLANIKMFNALHAQMMEFCEIGKILYKGVNHAKQQDYTFTELLKQVRHTGKKQAKETQTDTMAD